MRVGIARGRQRKNDDDGNKGKDWKNEDTTFGAGESSAHERSLAKSVRGVEVVFDHEAAVSDAVKKRLRPIPRSVQADGPPERTGAPEAEAEDEAGKSGG